MVQKEDNILVNDMHIKLYVSFQIRLKHGIKSGEKAIHMVNQLHLYSDNENIDEVATNEVKYVIFFLNHFMLCR
jgi:hypothetical protein